MVGDIMKCHEKCEFQEFSDGKFECQLYESDLVCFKESGQVSVIRCKKCIEEKVEYDLIARKDESSRME